MNTIFRWTIGNVSKQGFDCLELSVKKIQKLYGNKEFKYFICHNNIEIEKLKKINNVELIDQKKFVNYLPIPPSNKFGVSWKLYPPRIELDSKEIFVDNDVVIHKKIDFSKLVEMCFISEAAKKSYGSFEEKINSCTNMNSGFFGLPPGFDFASKISKTIYDFDVKWDDSYFEEQGLVSYVLSESPHWVIGLKDVLVTWGDTESVMGEYGTHFIGLNRGSDSYWNKYRRNSIKSL